MLLRSRLISPALLIPTLVRRASLALIMLELAHEDVCVCVPCGVWTPVAEADQDHVRFVSSCSLPSAITAGLCL
jgi:hypothetical protein